MFALNIENIVSYLEYLKNDCNLSVSVHFSKEAFATLPNELCTKLLPHNSHNNPYCMAIKKDSHEMCICSQRQLRENSMRDISLCRTCFAGVSEYIYPVFRGESPIGFVAVSGYLGENARESLKLHLKDEPIPKKLCDALIPPLAFMLEGLFLQHIRNETDEYNQILQFLNEYHANITVSQIADYFGRSVSHISHLFKSKSGISISEYCNRLRLQDAEKLLLGTTLSVTRIALDTGFCDTSYFIRLFRKAYKQSPLQYRKKQHKTERNILPPNALSVKLF